MAIDKNVSIHAPARGGDKQDSFNCNVVIAVSIHAPARGGDRGGFDCVQKGGRFQFTPPRGGATQYHIRRKRIALALFQFTPPRGGATGPGRGHRGDCGRFNSRPREGGRPCPPRSARPAHQCFNSRPREGGRPSTLMFSSFAIGFNSRPREGGRLQNVIKVFCEHFAYCTIFRKQ